MDAPEGLYVVNFIVLLNFYGIKFRLHAQALTLAALAGAAVVEYYDHKARGKTTDRYAKFLPLDTYSKD